jgi:hypothetical protein
VICYVQAVLLKMLPFFYLNIMHVDITELVLWFIIPTIVGLMIAIATIRVAAKAKQWWSWLLTTMILLMVVYSEYVLLFIWIGAYPSYIPHFFIILSGCLVLFQRFCTTTR